MTMDTDFGSFAALVQRARTALLEIQLLRDRNDRVSAVDNFIRRFISRDIDAHRDFEMDQIRFQRDSGGITFEQSIPLQNMIIAFQAKAEARIREMGEMVKNQTLGQEPGFQKIVIVPEGMHQVSCSDPTASFQDLDENCFANNIVPIVEPVVEPITVMRELQVTLGTMALARLRSKFLFFERALASLKVFGWVATSTRIDGNVLKVNFTKVVA